MLYYSYFETYHLCGFVAFTVYVIFVALFTCERLVCSGGVAVIELLFKSGSGEIKVMASRVSHTLVMVGALVKLGEGEEALSEIYSLCVPSSPKDTR